MDHCIVKILIWFVICCVFNFSLLKLYMCCLWSVFKVTVCLEQETIFINFLKLCIFKIINYIYSKKVSFLPHDFRRFVNQICIKLQIRLTNPDPRIAPTFLYTALYIRSVSRRVPSRSKMTWVILDCSFMLVHSLHTTHINVKI